MSAFLTFIFGATSYPIYSVSAAYANDFAEKDFVVELNAALIFFYSIGAIISPTVSAARLTRLRNTSRSSGFSMKSYAPSLKAALAVGTSPCAVMKIR